MGRAGPGNLDSDAAFEHLSEVCDEILARIRNTTSNERLMEPDEFESDALLLDVEILVALKNADLLISVPEPDEVARWQSDYLRIWDGYIVKLATDEQYIRARRKVISDTFERLFRISVDHHGPTDVTD